MARAYPHLSRQAVAQKFGRANAPQFSWNASIACLAATPARRRPPDSYRYPASPQG
jgi:hypothetical protein